MPVFNGEILGITGEVPHGSVLISAETKNDEKGLKNYPMITSFTPGADIYGLGKIYIVGSDVAEQIKKDDVEFYKHGHWPMPPEARQAIREALKRKRTLAPI